MYSSQRIDTQSLHDMYTGTLQGSVYDSASLEGAHSLEDRAVPTVDPRYNYHVAELYSYM